MNCTGGRQPSASWERERYSLPSISQWSVMGLDLFEIANQYISSTLGSLVAVSLPNFRPALWQN